MGNFTVSLKKLTEKVSMDVVYTPQDLENISVEIAEVNRPGLFLAGYYDYFDKLRLPAWKKTKTGYSTDVEVLEQLKEQHPIIACILEYRKATKLKSTYLDGLQAVSDQSNGRVHTRFHQNITLTGRISSSEPNLQNIPVRTEEGREIRRAFIPSDEDRCLVVADYSQIELRILAHMAKEDTMIDTFRHGGDIHAATAAKVYGVDQESVTKDMRSSAKAVNFGIVYGISDFGLSRNLNIPRKQAATLIQSYFETYPKIRGYMDQCVADGRAHGFVETIIHEGGYVWIAYGMIITIVPLLLAGFIGRYAFKLNYYTLIGVLAGSTTNPPALAYSNDLTSCDAPAVGYATVYPLTMFLRVLTAQLLILSLG